MSDRHSMFGGLAALWLLSTAALIAATTAAVAQQAQPPGPSAQPQVGLGVAIEEDPQGPKVGGVAPGGTAAAMGVRPGDILLQFGGKSITGPQSAGEYVQGLKVGDPVSITVKRDGRTIELNSTALARPAPPPNRSTTVAAGELRETWNDRASQGTPAATTPEVNGWTIGTAMPLARAEQAVAELNGKVWVLGGWPPGRLLPTWFKSSIRPQAAGRWA